MKGRRSFGFESLESRYCLSVAAVVDNGDLVVSGDAEGPVAIVAAADGTFSVTDNGVEVAAGLAVTDDVRINLDASAGANDQVALDLGTATVDEVSVKLGAGDNSFSLTGGTITGSLKYFGGADGDTLVVNSEIAGGVYARLGAGENIATIDGQIGRDVVIQGGSDDDQVTIDVDAVIARGVSLHLGNGDNEVRIAGDITGGLGVHTGIGKDLLELLASASVGRFLIARLGGGDNDAILAGDVTGGIAVRAGAGNDDLSITADASIGGSVQVKLGDGTNTFNHAGEITGDLRVTSATAEDVFTVAETGIVGGVTELTPGEQMETRGGHCGQGPRLAGRLPAVTARQPLRAAFRR
jgi:hypothetical protein